MPARTTKRKAKKRRRPASRPAYRATPREPSDRELDELLELSAAVDDDEFAAIFAAAQGHVPRALEMLRARAGELHALGRTLVSRWHRRAGDCGAGWSRFQRGLSYAVSDAVVEIGIQRGRLRGLVEGTSEYSVQIDVAPPPAPALRALDDALAAARRAEPGGRFTLERLRPALLAALASADDALFPSPADLHGRCTCPDGAPCKHLVAVVYTFGSALAAAPEHLLALWGLVDAAAALPSERPRYQVPALAADKQALDEEDLAALFGLPMVDGGARPTPRASGPAASSEVPAPPPAALEPAPVPAPALAPAPATGPVTAPAPAPELAAPELAAPEPVEPTPPAPKTSSTRTHRPAPTTSPSQPAAPASDSDPDPSPAPPPRDRAEVEREYLRVLGVPAATIDAWLRAGILARTPRRGVYQRTPEANRRIAEHLAR